MSQWSARKAALPSVMSLIPKESKSLFMIGLMSTQSGLTLREQALRRP